jgi:hypothetical protein
MYDGVVAYGYRCGCGVPPCTRRHIVKWSRTYKLGLTTGYSGSRGTERAFLTCRSRGSELETSHFRYPHGGRLLARL